MAKKRFKVMIECENAAFDDDSIQYEIARILRETAGEISAGEDRVPNLRRDILDTNGNLVGYYQFIKR